KSPPPPKPPKPPPPPPEPPPPPPNPPPLQPLELEPLPLFNNELTSSQVNQPPPPPPGPPRPRDRSRKITIAAMIMPTIHREPVELFLPSAARCGCRFVPAAKI